MGDLPRKPSGSDAEAKYAQSLYQRVYNESRLGNVTGHRVMNTTGGKMIIPAISRGLGSGAGLETYVIRYVEDDYFVCRSWDGTNIGTEDVYIAKAEELKCSPASAPCWLAGPVFGAQTFTYARDPSEPDMEYGTTVPDSDPAVNEWGETASLYSTGNQLAGLKLNTVRTATVDGIIEQQRVIPLYFKGDIIRAEESDFSATTTTGLVTDSGKSIDLVDLNVAGRVWARI